MTLQKLGAIGAVLQAVEAVIVGVLVFYLVPSIGVTLNDFGNPDKILPVADHLYLKINSLTTVLFSGTSVIVVLGLYDYMKGEPRALLAPALAAAVIASALLLAKGFFGLASGQTYAALYATNKALAISALPATQLIIHATQNAAFFAGGVAAFLYALAGLQTKKLPAILCYLLIAGAIVAVLYFFVVVVRFVQLPLTFVSTGWLGAYMWRAAKG